MSVTYVDFRTKEKLTRDKWLVRIFNTLSLSHKYRIARKRIEIKSKQLRQEIKDD